MCVIKLTSHAKPYICHPTSIGTRIPSYSVFLIQNFKILYNQFELNTWLNVNVWLGSVIIIIWIMLSVWICSKVIILSGLQCTNTVQNEKKNMLCYQMWLKIPLLLSIFISHKLRNWKKLYNFHGVSQFIPCCHQLAIIHFTIKSILIKKKNLPVTL